MAGMPVPLMHDEARVPDAMRTDANIAGRAQLDEMIRTGARFRGRIDLEQNIRGALGELLAENVYGIPRAADWRDNADLAGGIEIKTAHYGYDLRIADDIPPHRLARPYVLVWLDRPMVRYRFAGWQYGTVVARDGELVKPHSQPPPLRPFYVYPPYLLRPMAELPLPKGEPCPHQPPTSRRAPSSYSPHSPTS